MNLNRPSFASRRPLSRQLANAAFQAKKKDTKTVTTSLNEFKQNVALANFRLCVLCEQYQLSTSAIEIINTDPLYETLNLDNQPYLRRQNKFWICLVCKASGKKNEELFSPPIMRMIEIDGRQILYPGAQDGDDNIQITRDTLLLVPHSVTRDEPKGRNFSINMYNNQDPTNTFVSTLYNLRLSKFIQRKMYADLYEGEILADHDNRLQSVAKVVDTSAIRSSLSWKSK